MTPTGFTVRLDPYTRIKMLVHDRCGLPALPDPWRIWAARQGFDLNENNQPFRRRDPAPGEMAVLRDSAYLLGFTCVCPASSGEGAPREKETCWSCRGLGAHKPGCTDAADRAPSPIPPNPSLTVRYCLCESHWLALVSLLARGDSIFRELAAIVVNNFCARYREHIRPQVEAALDPIETAEAVA